MKKLIVFFIVCISLGFAVISMPNKAFAVDTGYDHLFEENDCIKIQSANSNINNISSMVCSYNNQKYQLNLTTEKCYSKIQQNVNNLSLNQKFYIIDKIVKMGFSLEIALNYVFPGLQRQVEQLKKNLQILPTNAYPVADNKNNISFKEKTNGQELDIDKLYNDIYLNLLENKTINLSHVVTQAELSISDIKDNFKVMSSFYTGYESSGNARKNNIVTACRAINGKIIKNGETFSFNDTTGLRTEENGYQEAKIIVNGKYTEGYGGGVCQVSTTLYNACLLAGLDIAEVHNHSLPASYVNPCFDAMVNTGSSDLKITNNTGSDCIITASTINNRCKIVIYGVPSKYKIVRRYEKYQTLPAPEDRIETDLSLAEGLPAGKHQIISGAEGFKARGYLDYYVGDCLIKSKKIRDNTYNPKQGVVVIVEE